MSIFIGIKLNCFARKMDFYSQNEEPTDSSSVSEQHPDSKSGIEKRKSVIKKVSRKSVTGSADNSNSITKIKRKKLSESSSSDDGQAESKRTKNGHPLGLGFYSSGTVSTEGTPQSTTAATSIRKRKQDLEDVRQPKHAKDNLDQQNVPTSMISIPNAERMMQRMGYKPGAGLGRHGEGIKEPIEPKSLAARSGLGFSIPGLELGKQDWNFEAEEIVIEEKVQWLPPPTEQPKWTLAELLSWRLIDKESLDISQATDFCDKDVLQKILKSKDTLDSMDNRKFGDARFRSNPFEKIGKAIYMNRAAVKMANLDAILNFELTMSNPTSSLISTSAPDLFYFADVCAGPGGFSEYVLWKKGWQAKGFGFTLKGDCDFKLGDFIAGTPETFEPHYGVNDDGNIFDTRNIESFIAYVKSATDGQGVHLMMADGGFSVEGRENFQEILSKQLYLSQIVVALAILREGGNFICKLFDIFTSFSVGLIYLLRACFDGIAIHKPNTSRPANSERYVLCKGRKSTELIEPTLKYLLDTHELMWQLSRDKDNNPKKDVMELVPLNILLNDDEFHNYIYNSNNHLGERQIQNLEKIVAFYRDISLVEKRQHETKLQCLKFWKVPIERRRAFPKGAAPEPPQTKFYDLLKSDDASFIRNDETALTTSSMKSTFRSPCDWAAVAICGDRNRSKRGLYLGLGGTKVFRLNGARWDPVDIKMELYRDTLVYGEIVDEVRDVTRPSASRRVAFHIIDGMVLGGEDVRGRDFWERQRMCERFAKALNKPTVVTLVAVRAKQVIPMERIGQDLLHGLSRNPPGSKIYLPIDLGSEQTSKILVGGLLFLKLSSDPWMIVRSKREQKLYYYNTQTRYSSFETISDASADFKYTMSKRVVWWWDNQTNFGVDDATIDSSSLEPTPGERVHVTPFLRFMQSIPS